MREVDNMRIRRLILGMVFCASISTWIGCANRTAYNPYQGYPPVSKLPPYAQPGQPIQPSPLVGTPASQWTACPSASRLWSNSTVSTRRQAIQLEHLSVIPLLRPMRNRNSNSLNRCLVDNANMRSTFVENRG